MTTSTSPAARLRAAAAHLRTLLAAIATESPADLPLHADGRTVTQGRVGLHDFATAATPEVAAFIVAMGPLPGEALIIVLDQAVQKIAASRAAGEYLFGDQASVEAYVAERVLDVAPVVELADAILGAGQ